MLKAGRFAKQAQDLKLYRSIATMDKKAPLPKIAARTPTWHKAAALARKWQLNQLAGRLEEMARKPPPWRGRLTCGPENGGRETLTKSFSGNSMVRTGSSDRGLSQSLG